MAQSVKGGRPTAMQPDNRLALMDQAFYASHLASGQIEVMQVVWGYERAIDLDALRRFHGNLASSLLGRLIERSPLPFGRYRWIKDPHPSELDIAEHARPRAEIADWLDERALLPINPESGPGWRLSVLRLTDGSTVVTLVMSHYVLDGVGGVVAVARAILDDTPGYGYPPPRSRKRWRALLEDAGEAARAVPEAARALVTATKVARSRRGNASRSCTPTSSVAESTGDGHELVTIPGVWIRMDLDRWEARAKALGGTGGTLVTALTARLSANMGRRRTKDGEVEVTLVVGNRTEDDTRAVAVSFARVSVDPTPLTTDLRTARAAIKQGLAALTDTQDESAQLVALTPFTPRPAWRRLMDQSLQDAEQPAACSNLGEVGPVIIRPDGNPCDYAWLRGIRQQLTRHQLEQMASTLQLFFGQGAEVNKAGIHIAAYQAGSITTKAALRDLVARTLAEFGLTGDID